MADNTAPGAGRHRGPGKGLRHFGGVAIIHAATGAYQNQLGSAGLVLRCGLGAR